MTRRVHKKVRDYKIMETLKNFFEIFGVPKIYDFLAYDLPNSWRLIYTIQTNEVMILNVILEWFNHKGYERRFKY